MGREGGLVGAEVLTALRTPVVESELVSHIDYLVAVWADGCQNKVVEDYFQPSVPHTLSLLPGLRV